MSLGRKGGKAGKTISNAERYLMIDIQLIEQYLATLECTDAADPQALLEMRESMHRTLRLLGTETLGKTLGDVLGSLPSLAQQLGKEAPLVRIDDNCYQVRSQAGGVLHVTKWLSVHYNQSANFTVAGVGEDEFGNVLPSPSGTTSSVARRSKSPRSGL